MRIRKNKKGFTLLELLIVLVVIGVIAGLMFPVLTSQVEKSRAQEAVAALGTAKEAMVRYYALNGNTYVGATFANIGYDPNAAQGGQNPLFAYVISNLGAATFTITANANPGGVQRAGTTLNVDTVSITQTGPATRTGIYA